MRSRLFLLNDVLAENPEEQFEPTGEMMVRERTTEPLTIMAKGMKKLEELFPQLHPDRDLHFMSHGEWSTHELIMHLLTKIGPADLYFTTWSLKEYPVRLLMGALENKQLLSITALLDARVRVRNPEVLHLAKAQFTKIREYDCHAKVFVLENSQWKISLVGSANMTNNPRVEACVLSTHPDVAAFHKSWIKRLVEFGEELHGD